MLKSANKRTDVYSRPIGISLNLKRSVCSEVLRNTLQTQHLTLYKGMYMNLSRIDAASVDEVASARKSKESLKAIEPFLTCFVSKRSAKEYVNTLVEHNMLYFFEEDANNVVVYDIEDGAEVERTFTTRQATMLNVIRNRFRHDVDAFETMFDTVFCNDQSSLETDDDRAYDYMEAEQDITDGLYLVN